MYGVLGFTAPLLPVEAPKHLLGIGEPDDLLAGIELGIDTFDCAVPTRLARHGTALANLPDARFRFDLDRSRFQADDRPLVEGCPCPTCRDHTRAYLHYLVRAEQPTAARLLTVHNLCFLERLAAGARESIAAGEFDRYKDAVLQGSAPWATECARGRSPRSPGSDRSGSA
jgi:queuine tRNA-ribosyltransferase